ncbi:MAG TPA: N-6 DNA methylase, partial [Anaerolineales bacterium]|nr:N-6 DNA methylase [Anaerolineales bacterium]
STILTANSLYPAERKTSAEGWNELLEQFNSTDGFDVIIANPPWGADISAIKESLQQGDFTLSKGQFDTSDLFIELALRLLKPDGYLAFIVPDSLFSQERIPLRKLLLDRTEVRFVGRMGEKIFENINRACALIICKKTELVESTATTQCLRLTPDVRRNILEGSMTFLEADKLLTHDVLQQRFFENRDYRFDIDTASLEQTTLGLLNARKARLKDFLVNARGIELSKTGRVYQCEYCDQWLPFPSRPNPRCPHCKSELSLLPNRIDTIVSSEPRENSERLLIGESIQRYRIGAPLWIDCGRVGINYKPSLTYQSPKLLIRKTGVGISGAIDYSNSYTN